MAYKRRYLTLDGWKLQYVVDFVAEKLHEEGYDLSAVEDAYSLSFDVEKRIAFQAFVQGYVDNSISSTVNLPSGAHENGNVEKFGSILLKYLPKMRGITVYPDGARGGQPLTPVDFDTAIKHKGVVFEGNEDCAGGICGL
jgi:ribonucleoside-diphosphate reductase alpha chain